MTDNEDETEEGTPPALSGELEPAVRKGRAQNSRRGRRVKRYGKSLLGARRKTGLTNKRGTRLRRYASPVNEVIFEDGPFKGMIRMHRFMATALDLWMRVIETETKDGWFEPLLSADGEPVLNQFGQRRETRPPLERPFRMRAGCAWMTKDLLRAAWFEEFKESAFFADYPEHYETGPGARLRDKDAGEKRGMHAGTFTRANGTEVTGLLPAYMYAHPMDNHLTQWVKRGVLRKKEGGYGEYFPSQAICEHVDRQAIFDKHEVLATVAKPNPQKHTSVQAAGWADVLDDLSRYTVWDSNSVHVCAQLRGLMGEEYDAQKVGHHLGHWTKKGQIKKLASSVFVTTEPHPKGRVEKAKIIDWMAFILREAGRRYWNRLKPLSIDEIKGMIVDARVVEAAGMNRFRRYASPPALIDDAVLVQVLMPGDKRKHYALAEGIAHYFNHEKVVP